MAEIDSQPRICQDTAGHVTFQPGWRLDLTMKDPAAGQPWDLGVPSFQSRVKKGVRNTKPYCLNGSPPCTAFFQLQAKNKARRDPKVVKRELVAGKRHIRSCVELYCMQIGGRRPFVQEHPDKSKAWEMPEVQQLLLRLEVRSTTVHVRVWDDRGG